VTASECRGKSRVLDESRDLKFSYREMNFSKINIPSHGGPEVGPLRGLFI